MKITTFNNMKGLIHGGDPKRIGCEQSGVLRIGTTEVIISTGADSIMPLLFHGGTGDYDATFTTTDGLVYNLEKVEVRNGRIAPPPPTAVEMMELRLRADNAERKYSALLDEVHRLANIFDTDSLNFLIK
jgi:hypothetical protein